MISRRSLITGLATVLAAPAIVRAGSLMPVKVAPTQYMDMQYKGAPVLFDTFDNPAFVQEMLDAIQQDRADRCAWELSRLHGLSLMQAYAPG